MTDLESVAWLSGALIIGLSIGVAIGALWAKRR